MKTVPDEASDTEGTSVAKNEDKKNVYVCIRAPALIPCK